jgi:hypothetical protein
LNPNKFADWAIAKMQGMRGRGTKSGMKCACIVVDDIYDITAVEGVLVAGERLNTNNEIPGG